LSNKLAIVSLGNTLRRDDGIGITVLRSLLKFYKQEGIDYLDFGSASFDLINRMRNYDIVLLIDGIKAGLPAGEVKIFELAEIEYNSNASFASTHEFDLKNIFELVKNLGLKTKIYVAGIQVEDTSYGEGLSEVLKKKKKDIIKEINAFINEVLSINSV